jgi:hypothetical protein
MKIITKSPVVTEKSQLFQGDPSEYYYNGIGDTSGTGQNKIVWDKVKQAWVKAKESGLLDKGLDLVKARLGRPTSTQVNVPLPPPPPPEPTGLSKNAKIGIAVGGVVVLGLVIFLATRKTGK